MKKYMMIPIFLLVFFIAVASVSATDMNAAIDDGDSFIDVDEVELDVSQDMNAATDDGDSFVEVNEAEEDVSQDMDTTIENDPISHSSYMAERNGSVSKDAYVVSEDFPICQFVNVMGVRLFNFEDNIPGLLDRQNDSLPTVMENVSGNRYDFLPANPNHIVVTKEMIDALQEPIDFYYNSFEEKRFTPLDKNANGPRYELYELIIHVYANYNYVDTIIIVDQVLKKNYYSSSEAIIEGIMNRMRNGTCEKTNVSRDPSYYPFHIKMTDIWHKVRGE